ncbi:MAG TPA: DUF1275 family protein [Nevskia sp.]|nr:DUF1275 family protein [Nevskia sp.]
MAAPSPETGSRPGTVAVLLSFVAGYVDTVGFVALFGLFTAHVTGNLVLIGASLIHSSHGLVAKLSALPVFVLVVGLTTLYAQRRSSAGKPALPGALAAQLLFLAGFAAVGSAAAPVTDADAPLAILAGMLGVCAMSVQNAASRLLMGELPPTTVMTGGVTQFAIDAAALLAKRSGPDSIAARKRLHKFVPPVLAFAAGAIAGALLYARLGFVVLLVPMAALVAVLLLCRPRPQSAGVRP